MVSIGIDLGTTHSVVSWYNPELKKSIILSDPNGVYIIPSVVQILENGTTVVGEFGPPEKTISLSKRFIGKEKEYTAMVNDKLMTFSPIDINAIILKYLMEVIEYHGLEYTEVVITVPAYFNHIQRNCILKAAHICGLNVACLISEPTAAAVAYGIDRKSDKSEIVLVVDLGGGTHDVSVMTISNGLFSVLATNGNPELGGEDINNLLSKKYPDLSDKTIEVIKRELSFKKRVWIDDFTSISQKDFIEICKPFWESFMLPIEKVMNDIQYKPIDSIVLVGGSTRIPHIKELVANYFKVSIDSLNCSLNPDEAIAYGAAVHSFYLNAKESDFIVMDVVPMTIGLKENVNTMLPLIPRNSFIPTSFSEIVSPDFKEQTHISIELYQGESNNTDKNILISTIFLEVNKENKVQDDIKVKVTVLIDESGVMTFSADFNDKKEKVVLDLFETFQETEIEF